ncbi:unnamed protein product [Symbiodinium microadriaticum]|nr:unnamed protein product [Symbiodinium microadriaticum]
MISKSALRAMVMSSVISVGSALSFGSGMDAFATVYALMFIEFPLMTLMILYIFTVAVIGTIMCMRSQPTVVIKSFDKPLRDDKMKDPIDAASRSSSKSSSGSITGEEVMIKQRRKRSTTKIEHPVWIASEFGKKYHMIGCGKLNQSLEALLSERKLSETAESSSATVDIVVSPVEDMVGVWISEDSLGEEETVPETPAPADFAEVVPETPPPAPCAPETPPPADCGAKAAACWLLESLVLVQERQDAEGAAVDSAELDRVEAEVVSAVREKEGPPKVSVVREREGPPKGPWMAPTPKVRSMPKPRPTIRAPPAPRPSKRSDGDAPTAPASKEGAEIAGDAVQVPKRRLPPPRAKPATGATVTATGATAKPAAAGPTVPAMGATAKPAAGPTVPAMGAPPPAAPPVIPPPARVLQVIQMVPMGPPSAPPVFQQMVPPVAPQHPLGPQAMVPQQMVPQQMVSKPMMPAMGSMVQPHMVHMGQAGPPNYGTWVPAMYPSMTPHMGQQQQQQFQHPMVQQVPPQSLQQMPPPQSHSYKPPF